MRRGALVTVALLWGCTLPTSPVQEWLHAEWTIGQKNVALLIGDDAYLIGPERFHFEAIDGAFMCGDVLANGCFSERGRRIRYNTLTPTVIRHEAGHAILWALHRACWHDFEHEEDACR